MASDLVPFKAERAPQLAAHWKRLQVRDLEAFKQAPLIGKWQITVILRELDAAMKPATLGQAAQVAKLLVGSYPRHAIAEPEIYAVAMATLLSDYPADVGADAVDALTRKCKFMPTRAELAEELDAIMGRLRWAQFIAEQTERERKRREDEAATAARVANERAAFLVKHGGKSPLQVLADMGLFNTAKVEENGKSNTGDQGQADDGVSGKSPRSRKRKGGDEQDRSSQ